MKIDVAYAKSGRPTFSVRTDHVQRRPVQRRSARRWGLACGIVILVSAWLALFWACGGFALAGKSRAFGDVSINTGVKPTISWSTTRADRQCLWWKTIKADGTEERCT